MSRHRRRPAKPTSADHQPALLSQPSRQQPAAMEPAQATSQATAGLWDLWDELSRRAMAWAVLKRFARSVQRHKAGIETFAEWREFFRGYESFGRPITEPEWDAFSTRMLQTARKYRAETGTWV